MFLRLSAASPSKATLPNWCLRLGETPLAPLEVLKKMDFNSTLSTVNTFRASLEGFVDWDRMSASLKSVFGYGKCDIIFLGGQY